MNFCSSNNKFYFWRTCIKNHSQIFILTPLLHGLNIVVLWFVLFPLINQYVRYEHKNNIYRHENVTIRHVFNNSATISFKICTDVQYLLRVINVSKPSNLQITASQKHLVFNNWHCVPPEDGTHVSQQAGEAHLMFILIKNVHLGGIINGVRFYV